MRILVIAAHPDDEVLGVGGTILKHKKNGDEVYICIVTTSYEPEWSKKYKVTKLKEAKKVDNILCVKKRVFCDLPTVKLNTIPHGEFNKIIGEVIEDISPDVIYTHFEGDVNKDHGIIFQAVMVATRPVRKKTKVLCFETPSSTEWNNKAFIPNLYVDITPYIDKKVEAFSQYKSEVKKYSHPRSKKGLKIWANKRGIEICTEYAEAFQIVRSFW
ncbi:MAG: PIG-L family deacetylase [Nanoarchaeota archaeon]|nr:PIG-L family deacetylase [DPANN group archaeon]MBL7116677.1 PIG-L family deacetylase [Nanoarchaeota archaeon]